MDTEAQPSERTPLLVVAAEDVYERPQNVRKQTGDVIDFDTQGDVSNPQEWSRSFKCGIVALMALMGFITTFTCISVVPVANHIVEDLSGGHGSKSASILLVTIWELGEAVGPLFIAPLSEEFGRYPVFNGANVIFIVSTLLAAFADNVPLFIGARVLTGLAVASNVLCPSIVGDIFSDEERGSAVSIVMLAPLVGGAIGPTIGSALAESFGWRSLVLLAAGLAIVCETLFLIFFQETYKVVILRRRAEKLEAQYHCAVRAPAVDGHAGKENLLRRIWEPVIRPAEILSSSGVLMALSLSGSVVFTTFYIMSVTLPDILEDVYHIPAAVAGTPFMCFSVGSIVANFCCNLGCDRLYIKLKKANNGVGKPEYTLPFSVIGGILLPLALAMYGWAAQLGKPLPVFLVSVGFLGFSLILAYIPLMTYVVSAFGNVSASATTGVIVIRCLMGAFLPLATSPLVGGFGYGWGFTIFATGCLALAPIPAMVIRYGSKWRQRSIYSRDVQVAKVVPDV